MSRLLASGQYFTVGNVPSVDQLGLNATWHCWVYATGTRGGLISAWEPGGQYIISHQSDSAMICSIMSSGFPGPAAVASNVWVPVAMRNSQALGNYQIFHNGAAIATMGGNNPNITDTGAVLYFGTQNGSGAFMVGRLAEVALWNVALTDAEILALAKGANPTTVRLASLKGYWPLHGNASPEPDFSAAKANATVNGASTLAPHAPVSRSPMFAG